MLYISSRISIKCVIIYKEKVSWFWLKPSEIEHRAICFELESNSSDTVSADICLYYMNIKLKSVDVF